MLKSRHLFSADLIEVTGKIVSAYVTRNHVSAVEIPALLNNVHAALVGLVNGTAPIAAEVEVKQPTPSEIRKSVGPDALISFIDGKIYKTLKRHLSAHGLDPRSYRERYGLPTDYPMVAASYAERRSALAKAIGLGKPGAIAGSAVSGRKAG